MTVFVYDKTFEGLLTAVFDAYSRRSFPDLLLAEGEPFPLFYDEAVTICTDDAKVDRVWKGLQKRLSAMALSVITVTWLSELPETDMLLFRYIRKAIDAPRTIELNFGDPDVLEVSKVWKKVTNERLRVIQFLRFQKTADGTFFAAVKPVYNVLPLTLPHLKDRFADATLDHQWIHVDPERAKVESPFHSTIAHGYLTLSLLPHLWNQIIEVNNLKMMINYGMDKMKFGQPVLTGQSIRLIAKLQTLTNLRGVAKAEIKFAIEIKDQPKKALEGVAIFLYYFN